MEKEWIYRNIDKLKTPVGWFSVYSGDKKIPFSVVRNGFDVPSEVVDDDGNVLGTIHTETNYAIVLETRDLELGKEYVVRFSAGKWAYCNSDDRTTCFFTMIEDWAVGIGGYEPNEYEKEAQRRAYSEQCGALAKGVIQPPPAYDESKFEKYTAEEADDCNGYRFKLLEDSAEGIVFNVAWVRMGTYPAAAYEEALGLWLC